MRDRIDRLAAGFRVRGEQEIKPATPVFTGAITTASPSPAVVQVRRPNLERLELTPDEADALADALRAEAAFARGES